jgi:hypothetical protein
VTEDGFILMITVPSELARFAGEVLPILRERPGALGVRGDDAAR